MANLRDYFQYRPETTFDPSATRATQDLWKSQFASLNFINGDRCTLLYSEPSTGKTYVILRDAEQQYGLRLIVCPKKPLSVYAQDFENFWTFDKPFELHALDAKQGYDLTIKEKIAYIDDLYRRNANAVVILTYEAASRMPLSRWNFSAVYFDEGHRVGAYRSKQSIHFARECVDIPRKVVATGTAFHDGYERLYGIYRLFDPIIPANRNAYPISRLFGSYDNFLNHFTETWSKGHVRIIKKYVNTDRLAELIRPSCLHIKTSDIKELPKVVRRYYPVELAKETRIAYDRLEADAIIDFESSAILAPHVLSRLLRLQQLISSGELTDDNQAVHYFDIASRVEMLDSILDDLGSEPVVIFTRFKCDVEMISSLCKSFYGETPALLTGDSDTSEAWINGEGRFLIANVGAGSEGVRLQRAKHAIFWSVDYSLKKWVQAHARIRRTNSESDTVFYHHVQAVNTVDTKIAEALLRKSNDVDMLDEAIKG